MRNILVVPDLPRSRIGNRQRPAIADEAEKLRAENPGEWARVKTYPTRGTAGVMCAKVNGGRGFWAPIGTWEATTRQTDGGDTELYLKYRGEMKRKC